MELTKAIELLKLDIDHPGAVAIEDVSAAEQIGIEALNYIIRLRACSLEHRQNKLPSETLIKAIEPSPDKLKRLRESPLGRK